MADAGEMDVGCGGRLGVGDGRARRGTREVEDSRWQKPARWMWRCERIGERKSEIRLGRGSCRRVFVFILRVGLRRRAAAEILAGDRSQVAAIRAPTRPPSAVRFAFSFYGP